MPKYKFDFINSSTPKLPKMEFETREEMLDAISDQYGEKISSVDNQFFEGYMLPNLMMLKSVFPKKNQKALDSIHKRATDITVEYGDFKYGGESKNFKPFPDDSAPDDNMKMFTAGPTNTFDKYMPMRESDVEVFQRVFDPFYGELDALSSELDGFNPDEYVPGQDLTIDDMVKLEVMNVQYQLKMLKEGIAPAMLRPLSSFSCFNGTGTLGTSPQLGSDEENARYTPEQGRIMLNAMPVVLLENQANKMCDIQLSYQENLKKNGYDPEAERKAKLDYLKQAAKMKPVTTQCMMVARDKEFFGLGEERGSHVFTNGTVDISGDRSVIEVMDGNLEMYDTGIRRGWPLSDLDALGKLEYFSRRIEVFEKSHKELTEKDKESLMSFRDFVSDLKETDIKTPEDRERILNSALEHIKALPQSLKEAAPDKVALTEEKIMDSVNRQLTDAEKKEIGNLGPIKEELDKIEVRSFTEEQLDKLKERTMREMEYASSTLQAKGMKWDEKGDTTLGVTTSDAVNAFRGILNKNDSLFHFDSRQFKNIKAGLKKVQEGTASVKERNELAKNVKAWLTDPKYDRINKHSRNNFDNTRFNDMFALANELDPVWAHENFSKMNISGLHGQKAADTRFEDVDDFLQYEQKQIINNNCLKNSDAQKDQPWFQAGYSPSQENMIKDVENVWKSPEFNDDIRLDAEEQNFYRIKADEFSPEVKQYYEKMQFREVFRNDKGIINKEMFQEERNKALSSVESFIKDPKNKGTEKFEKAVAIYGIMEPVKAHNLVKELKADAMNKDNTKIQKLNLAALEKKANLDFGGRNKFREERAFKREEARKQAMRDSAEHTRKRQAGI